MTNEVNVLVFKTENNAELFSVMSLDTSPRPSFVSECILYVGLTV